MQRPAATRQALGRNPLVKTGGTHASRIERVPLVEAATRPEVVLAWRPPTQRTPDAGPAWIPTLLLLGFAVEDSRGFRRLIRPHVHRRFSDRILRAWIRVAPRILSGKSVTSDSNSPKRNAPASWRLASLAQQHSAPLKLDRGYARSPTRRSILWNLGSSRIRSKCGNVLRNTRLVSRFAQALSRASIARSDSPRPS